ncbi:MAG TPA: transglycosylase domain-containing protein, partial [Thermoanaerobaculia bacterium]
FGDAAGAREAAKRYFKKSPARLTEDEAVLLAASLFESPFDPEHPSEAVTERRASILEQLPKIGGEKSPVTSKTEELTKPKEAKKRKRKEVPVEAPVETQESAAEEESNPPSEPASTETTVETTTTETGADPPVEPPTDGHDMR